MGELEYKKIASIIAKFINGTISSDEEKTLDEWRQISPRHEALLKKYCSESFYKEMSDLYTPGEEKKLYQAIQRKISPRRKTFITYCIQVAAIFFLLIASGITVYHFMPNEAKTNKTFSDLKPGNSQATLYLPSGEKVALNSSKQIFPITGKTNNISTDGKIISFTELKENETILNNDNRIVVPRGGEYRLLLNDQTEIYLNSESEISFPTFFPDSLREVLFNGEAYFQISSDASHPFIIYTSLGIVKVTGTAFNLRCYKDERELQLTLEEGKVQFCTYDSDTWEEVEVGNQLVYQDKDKYCHISVVDTELYTSWRKGTYAFQKTPLKKIISDLSRWYNISVIYQDNSLQDITFTGEVKRYSSFDEIVKMLELTNTVHFEWKESKIHIIN